MKKTTKITGFLSLLALSVIAIGASNLSDNAKQVKAEATVSTDYSLFKIRGGNTGSVAANSDNTGIVYTGGWDSNFAVTDQFDTRAGNYSLKTHVYKSDWAISDDMGTGFTIYYNDTNFITFYLKWNNSECATSITEGTWLNHINGAYENAYQSAILPNGAFETRGNFTSVWSDGQWTKTLDGESINLRTESIILINKGFDMTLHVERSTYLDRLVDIIYVQIDALALDGTTPLTAYSPRYAVDAMTAPLGVKSNMADRKPQIGFMQFNMSDVVYSDIVFTNKNTDVITSEVKFVGAPCDTAVVNENENTLSYKNANFASSFLIPELNLTADSSIDLEATVSGTDGNANGTTVGFAYYYNDTNYAIIYIQWDGSLNTFTGVACYFVVNGATTNVTSAARNPWESTYATFGDFYVAWSDWQGWITDSPEPMGQYNNFNTLRNESAITIASGFSIGLQRTRSTYANRLVDIFQLHVTALGTDSHVHNWYSPTMCFDAYTYPNGSETASQYKDVAPQIGFYGINSGVTLSNVKANGKNIKMLSHVDSNVKSVEVKNAPTKTEYIVGEELDLSGTKLEVTYENGVTRELDVTSEMVSGFDSSKVGKNTLTFTYKGVSTTLDLNIINPVIQIELVGEPKTSFNFGNDLDLTDLKIKRTYLNGTVEEVEVTSDMVFGYDKNAVGKQVYAIADSGFMIQVEVEVNDYITEVNLKSAPTKVEYELGEALNLLGAQLEVKYASGATKVQDITPDMVKGFDSSKAGKQTIKVSFEGFNAQFEVTVKEPASEVEPEPTPTPAENNGCGGSVVAFSATLSILALAGIAAISYKKRH